MPSTSRVEIPKRAMLCATRGLPMARSFWRIARRAVIKLTKELKRVEALAGRQKHFPATNGRNRHELLSSCARFAVGVGKSKIAFFQVKNADVRLSAGFERPDFRPKIEGAGCVDGRTLDHLAEAEAQQQEL